MEQRIEELINRPYARVLVPDETGGYVAEVLELPGCISEGDTPDAAMENLEDAMRGWLQVAIEDGKHIPEPLESAAYNGRILLRVPRWVHARCVRLAQADGVSLNQWILEAIGERLGTEGFAERLLEEASAPVRRLLFEEVEVTTTRIRRLAAVPPEGEEVTKLLSEPGVGYVDLNLRSVAEKKESYNA